MSLGVYGEPDHHLVQHVVRHYNSYQLPAFSEDVHLDPRTRCVSRTD
jgi:hypothetical protein